MIVLFDLDSTLSPLEGCDLVAERNGVGKAIAEITEATMNGEMDFEEAFPRKTNMIAPSYEQVDKLGQLYIADITDGFGMLIESLHSVGIKPGILTQGYTHAARSIGQHLQIDPLLIAGVDLDRDQQGNYLRITPDQHIAHHDGKARIARRMMADFPGQYVVMVGDSVSDMTTQGVVDTFIGFGGNVVRTKVEQQAELYAYTVEQLQKMIHDLYERAS